MLKTADGNETEVVPASPLTRIAARLIDTALLILAVGLVQIVFLFTGRSVDGLLILAGGGWLFLDYLLADGIFFRCSLGKLLLNIRVVDARTLRPCSWKQSLFRNYSLFFNYVPLWEWAQLYGEKTLRFGDIMAGTMVIRNRRTR